MTLIGIYLSIPEWYAICNAGLNYTDESAAAAAHILDEIGYSLDVAPQYYAPRRNTCANCKNSKNCAVVAAQPLCRHYVKESTENAET